MQKVTSSKQIRTRNVKARDQETKTPLSHNTTTQNVKERDHIPTTVPYHYHPKRQGKRPYLYHCPILLPPKTSRQKTISLPLNHTTTCQFFNFNLKKAGVVLAFNVDAVFLVFFFSQPVVVGGDRKSKNIRSSC